jgi:hypothetical protein
MPQNFLFPQRDQPLLMPAGMREWLPEDDLAFVVLDAVATLDLGEFRRLYRADGHGRAAFDPAQIEKVLAEAAAADVAGDAKHGSSPPPATPRTLARRAGRRERLARARDRLAAEDKARRDASGRSRKHGTRPRQRGNGVGAARLMSRRARTGPAPCRGRTPPARTSG